jgi:hypothetical protein
MKGSAISLPNGYAFVAGVYLPAFAERRGGLMVLDPFVTIWLDA